MALNILFAYSRRHFCPPQDSQGVAEVLYPQSSSALIATKIYEALRVLGPVTYVDALEVASVPRQRFDLFVGIEAAFGHELDELDIGQRILVAVNVFASERAKILATFGRKYRSAIASTEPDPAVLRPLDLYAKHARLADSILLVGNSWTSSTFLRNGVPAKKLYLMNLGAPVTASANELDVTIRRFLYSATEVGLRKGFDILAATFQSLHRRDWRLTILGRAANQDYQRAMNTFQRRFPDQVDIVEWLDCTSEEYDSLLRQHHFFIMPSLEEGQPGTAVDALQRGLIPLITESVGLDWSPLGFLEASPLSTHNLELVGRALSLSTAEMRLFREQTVDYFNEFHSDSPRNLPSVLGRLAQRQPGLPLLSICVCIFNKEGTVGELVDKLISAAETYGNAELIFVFDGCVDNTESIVRTRMSKVDLPTKFITTDNIFEVRSNNVALEAASGDYKAIVQDDNYINDPLCFVEIVSFMERSNRAAIVGGLAGLFVYPVGRLPPDLPGRTVSSDYEAYWRIDADADPLFRTRVTQVDGCMRGPLVFRSSFLAEHGGFDERYAPLYNDDTDLCFRANSTGHRVYCLPADVENRRETMALADGAKAEWFNEIFRKNAKTFYSQWSPSEVKQQRHIQRTHLTSRRPRRIDVDIARQRWIRRAKAGQRRFRAILSQAAPRVPFRG